MLARPLSLGNAALGFVLERVVPAAVPQLHVCRPGRERSAPRASNAITMVANGGTYIPQVEVGAYAEQLTAKTQRLRDILSDFGPLPDIEVCRCCACAECRSTNCRGVCWAFWETSPCEQVLAGPAENYRCRTEFAIWHDEEGTHYVMFEKQPGKDKPQRVKIQQYPVASKIINSMMPIVMQQVCANEVLRRKLFQVNYHTTLSGHALVTIIYHKKLMDCEAEFTKAALQLRYAYILPSV